MIQPVLSILVTFCNQAPYASRCLASFFNQITEYPFEVLAAVDGPDDGIIPMLEEYSTEHSNLHFWHVSSDQQLIQLSRASQNRLFLLEKAKGRYIIVFDGDDFFCNMERFQRGIGFLEEHPEYVGHVVEQIWFDNPSQSYQLWHKRPDQAITYENYTQYNYVHIGACMFRNIFVDGFKYPSQNFFDDTCIVTYMLTHGNLWLDSEIMQGYRVGIKSIYKSKPEADQALMRLVTDEAKMDLTGDTSLFTDKIRMELRATWAARGSVTEEFESQVRYQKMRFAGKVLDAMKVEGLMERWHARRALLDQLKQEYFRPLFSTIVIPDGCAEDLELSLRSIGLQYTDNLGDIVAGYTSPEEEDVVSRYSVKIPNLRAVSCLSAERAEVLPLLIEAATEVLFFMDAGMRLVSLLSMANYARSLMKDATVSVVEMPCMEYDPDTGYILGPAQASESSALARCCARHPKERLDAAVFTSDEALSVALQGVGEAIKGKRATFAIGSVAILG